MKKTVIIKGSKEYAHQIGNMIHEQLVGNPDYIDSINSEIILDVGVPGEVHLYITDEAKPIELRLSL